MKTKTAFFAAVAAIGLTAQGAGLWDVSVADFPRAAGDGGDSARIMRAVDAAGTKGVVMFPRGVWRDSFQGDRLVAPEALRRECK